MTIRRTLALLAAAALIAGGYYVLTPPEVVHEFSTSTNLRAPNETLRARVGDDFTEIFPLPSGIRVEKDVGVILPDGTRMSVNIYRPDTNDRVPVVMALTSYDKDLAPEDYTINGRGPGRRASRARFGDFRVSAETPFEGPDPAYWVPHGYALVTVDAPGTGKSTGTKEPLGQGTVDAFAKVVTWTSEQPWSNGKVATVGVSYLAIIQWMVAAERPRGLAAIIPWEGATDPYRDTGFHGGIPETAFVRSWLAGPGSYSGTDDEPEFLTRRPLVTHVPLPFPYKGLVSFLNGVTPRPDEMPFKGPALERINVPALVAGSWSVQGLHTRGSFNGYMQIGSKEKWLFTHGRHEWDVMNSVEAMDYQRAFLDRFLKGIPDAMAGKPRVRLEVRRGGHDVFVRDENEWPIARTVYTPLYLDPLQRTLVAEKPTVPSMAQYNSTRDDTLDFRHRFDVDTEVTGHTKLRLWVSMDVGLDMDVFVAIRKIDKDGKVVLFDNHHAFVPVATRGWLRVSERKLDPARSTPWRPFLSHDEPLPVVPGERIPVDIEILPSSTFFEAGSELVLTIKGRDITAERGFQHKILMNQGRHTVWSGGQFDSHLLLPIVPGAVEGEAKR